MLQLPATTKISDAGVIKRGKLKGMLNVKPFSCPVLSLAFEYEALVKNCNDVDVPGDPDFDRLEKLARQMDKITDRVSYIRSTSYDGAAFQLLLVWGQENLVVNGGTAKIRAAARKRLARLLYRVMDRYGDGLDALPLARRYHMPDRCDPKKKPKPSGGSR